MPDNTLPKPILIRLSEHFGFPGKENTGISVTPLGGGCINNAVSFTIPDGTFFLKYNSDERYSGMFEKEALGLKILANAGSIRVPEVIYSGVADTFSFLVLEYIRQGTPGRDFWQEFGTSLASLHQVSKDHFGLDHDNYIGSLPQRNSPHKDWISFFTVERIEPLVRIARDRGELTSSTARKAENLCGRLYRLIPEEKPALVHGDLWNGNYMVDDEGQPCLIDPAVYYGHREADLAMSKLFGGFHELFYEYYNQAFPLEKGWEERIDLFNLYPLLVHVILFGGVYSASFTRIIDRFA